jgi:hypothetical protein
MRHIDERAPPRVPEQPVLADRRDKQVDVSVVVEIPDGNAHPEQRNVQSSRFRHVGKASVSVVAVQGQRGRLDRRTRIPRPTLRVDQQQILVAVSVVVEKCASAAHRLGQQFVSVRSAFVGKDDPRLVGHVGERDAGNPDRRYVAHLDSRNFRRRSRQRAGRVAEPPNRGAGDQPGGSQHDERPARGDTDRGIALLGIVHDSGSGTSSRISSRWLILHALHGAAEKGDRHLSQQPLDPPTSQHPPPAAFEVAHLDGE